MPKLKNIRWEKFCQEYVNPAHYGNGVQSYCIAFKKDPSKKSEYDSARAMTSHLLTNINILKRIEELLVSAGYNDVNVDKHRLHCIKQFENLGVKIKAIESYDKVKKRVGSGTVLETKQTTYEQHIHLHSHGTAKVVEPLRGSEERLQQIQGDVPEDQHEGVRDSAIQGEHSPGDLRGQIDEPSKGRKTYPGLCSEG